MKKSLLCILISLLIVPISVRAEGLQSAMNFSINYEGGIVAETIVSADSKIVRRALPRLFHLNGFTVEDAGQDPAGNEWVQARVGQDIVPVKALIQFNPYGDVAGNLFSSLIKNSPATKRLRILGIVSKQDISLSKVTMIITPEPVGDVQVLRTVLKNEDVYSKIFASFSSTIAYELSMIAKNDLLDAKIKIKIKIKMKEEIYREILQEMNTEIQKLKAHQKNLNLPSTSETDKKDTLEIMDLIFKRKQEEYQLLNNGIATDLLKIEAYEEVKQMFHKMIESTDDE